MGRFFSFFFFNFKIRDNFRYFFDISGRMLCFFCVGGVDYIELYFYNRLVFISVFVSGWVEIRGNRVNILGGADGYWVLLD